MASLAPAPRFGGEATFAACQHAAVPRPRAASRGGDSSRRSESGHSDIDANFRVVIRVRPPLERELASPLWHHAVAVSGESQVCLQEVVPEANAGDRASGSTAQVVNNHSFGFDRVYDQDASQPEVYAGAAHASVLSILHGYNATILAYGPTGTGKTYTMEGPRARGAVGGADARGIIPRSMEDVFQHVARCRDPRRRFIVRASYLQIYNEVISDLLKPDRTNLMIREDRRRGIFVDGLSEWLCRSPAEVQTLMEHGSAARATAQTGANDASSRSHAVFIVVVEQSEADGEGERAAGAPATDDGGAWRPVHVGRLNLVDLAGSERPRLTGATGQRLEETKKINQSLSAVGNVIAALTDRCAARQHIPYRDSKLTRLLEESLGGNCKTTMMAMVSPAAESFTESLSTLKFAHRAKGIRNSPRVNEDFDQRTLLRRYEAEVKRLRTELRESQQMWQKQIAHLEQQQQQQKAALCDNGFARAPVVALSDCSTASATPASNSERHFGSQDGDVGGDECDREQAGRYKQLLLKQREIMVALTQRLQERDEAIVRLQHEVDARDRTIAHLEGQIAAMTCGSVWRTAYAMPQSYPAKSTRSDFAAERSLQLLSADEKVAELSAMLHGQREENHGLRLRLEDLEGCVEGLSESVGGRGPFGALAASVAPGGPAPAAASSAPAPGEAPRLPSSALAVERARRSSPSPVARPPASPSRGSARGSRAPGESPCGSEAALGLWQSPAARGRSPADGERSASGWYRSISLHALRSLPESPVSGDRVSAAPAAASSSRIAASQLEQYILQGAVQAPGAAAGPACAASVGGSPAASVAASPAPSARSILAGLLGAGGGAEAPGHAAAAHSGFLGRGESPGPGARGGAPVGGAWRPMPPGGSSTGGLASFFSTNGPVRATPMALAPTPAIGTAPSQRSAAELSAPDRQRPPLPRGVSAEALRQEAQRSVDALLAKRRAELRRRGAASPGPVAPHGGG